MIGSFGLVGLLLAILGVYGVLSFQVTQRTREFGVRRALEANGRDLVKNLVPGGRLISSAGCGIGVLTSSVLAQLLESFLIRLHPLDPVTFTGVPFVLLAVAIAASLIPGLRATSVGAVEALREE